MSIGINNVHKTIEYALTQAAINNKISNYVLSIPYNELTAAVGATKYDDLNLKVTIMLEWTSSEDNEESEIEESL